MFSLAVSGMSLKWCKRNCYNTCDLSEKLIRFILYAFLFLLGICIACMHEKLKQDWLTTCTKMFEIKHGTDEIKQNWKLKHKEEETKIRHKTNISKGTNIRSSIEGICTGMQHPLKLRIGLCCSDLVQKTVPYRGSLISKCPQAVPCGINSGHLYLIFFSEMIIWCFKIY